MKRFLSALMAVMLLAALSSTAVLAEDNNGQKIGKDPVRLALTQCSNAGNGNGGEYEATGFTLFGRLGVIIPGDCLARKLVLPLADAFAVANAVVHQHSDLNCAVALTDHETGFFYLGCEIDPGNSAANNNAEK